jgi:uncharacterized protein YjbJ (UPF0337 family)
MAIPVSSGRKPDAFHRNIVMRLVIIRLATRNTWENGIGQRSQSQKPRRKETEGHEEARPGFPDLPPPEAVGRTTDNQGKCQVMDKDRLVGSGKQIIGAAKETVGKVVGDSKLQADGKAEKVEGKVQNVVGGVKDTVKDAVKGS